MTYIQFSITISLFTCCFVFPIPLVLPPTVVLLNLQKGRSEAKEIGKNKSVNLATFGNREKRKRLKIIFLNEVLR